jgi:HD superfamily phosphodiesterase
MLRKQILNQIKNYCQAEHDQIEDWVHNINHIHRVVKNGRKISQMENLKAKDAFLVEIACWLHDIGRVGEQTGLQFLQSNHAEVSYQKSKKLLAKYQKFLGREAVFKVLQAIREHNLPSLKHPENKIAQILIDSDRGAGINAWGIISIFNYLGVLKTEPVSNLVQARKALNDLLPKIKKANKIDDALEKIGFLKNWYYGSHRQEMTGVIVASLYTDSAKQLYKKGVAEIEQFEQKLKKLKK